MPVVSLVHTYVQIFTAPKIVRTNLRRCSLPVIVSFLLWTIVVYTCWNFAPPPLLLLLAAATPPTTVTSLLLMCCVMCHVADSKWQRAVSGLDWPDSAWQTLTLLGVISRTPCVNLRLIWKALRAANRDCSPESRDPGRIFNSEVLVFRIGLLQLSRKNW